MEFKILLSFLLMMIGESFGNQLKLYNNCPFTIWPGIQGNPGKAHLKNGGFKLDPYQTKVIDTPGDWAGKIWARTNCDASGHCQTGDCGNKIQCNGASGVPPATLVEVTLNGWFGLDYYDISLIHGYNLQIKMKPTSEYFNPGSSQNSCKAIGCHTDLNENCPKELAVKNSDGFIIGCKNACDALNTDKYCCRGAYNKPETCKITNWPVNYSAIFKRACPDAYTYFYDNTTLYTFTCRDKSYDIVFCPSK